MTLQEFSRDLVPLFQLVVSCAGLASLVLLWWQIRQTARWNKLMSQKTLLEESSLQYEQQLHTTARAAGVELKARERPLDSSEIDKLWAHNDAYYALISFLNNLENTCTAIQVGMVDPEVAYSVHAHRYCTYVQMLQPIIDKLRKHYDDDSICIEMQRVVAKWTLRRDSQKQVHFEETGVKRRV